MISSPKRILLIQTAFIGDVVLTLPLAQVLRRHFPGAHITFVAIPAASVVLANHPAIDEVIVYDKRGRDRGLAGIRSVVSRLRASSFDLALIPHRSIRSAIIGWLSHAPRRIGFSTSSGRWLFTDRVTPEPGSHEVERNLRLLKPLIAEEISAMLPEVHPNGMDQEVVTSLLAEHARVLTGRAMAAIAPGSVWATKRWPKEYFVDLAKLLLKRGFGVVLIGGKEDVVLCTDIQREIGDPGVFSAAGKLTLLQSADLIRRCRVAVSNDSAPMHLATAVRTPVVAIFGATVPEFGFAPRGSMDEVVETLGLTCRPCSIHGGNACPVKTFVCMKMISPAHVMNRIESILSRTEATQ